MVDQIQNSKIAQYPRRIETKRSLLNLGLKLNMRKLNNPFSDLVILANWNNTN